jgi:hypothetical protein
MTIAARARTPESLWRLGAAPAIWLAHFGTTYAIAVAACGRWQPLPPARARALVIAATAAALIGLAACLGRAASWPGRIGAPVPPPDAAADSGRFLARTNVLLVVLSAISVGFVAFGTVTVGVCR